jgi:hypothetical protein
MRQLNKISSSFVAVEELMESAIRPTNEIADSGLECVENCIIFCGFWNKREIHYKFWNNLLTFLLS